MDYVKSGRRVGCCRKLTSPIIGASKVEHLTDAAAALSLHLTIDEIKMLEAPYVPHKVAGFS